jgi:glucose-1-phosphate thymidylyltransferase
VLEDLVEAGVIDVAIVLGDVYPENVKEYYTDGSAFGAKLAYICQPEPKGIAHAVSLCEGFVGKSPFIVYLGDNLLKGGIREFALKFERSDADAMILLCEAKNPERFGVVRLDGKRLVGLVEKPKEPRVLIFHLA